MVFNLLQSCNTVLKQESSGVVVVAWGVIEALYTCLKKRDLQGNAE